MCSNPLLYRSLIVRVVSQVFVLDGLPVSRLDIEAAMAMFPPQEDQDQQQLQQQQQEYMQWRQQIQKPTPLSSSSSSSSMQTSVSRETNVNNSKGRAESSDSLMKRGVNVGCVPVPLQSMGWAHVSPLTSHLPLTARPNLSFYQDNGGARQVVSATTSSISPICEFEVLDHCDLTWI